MNDNNISTDRVLTTQCFYVDNQQDVMSTHNQPNSARIANVPKKVMKSPMTPTPLEFSCWSRYRSVTAASAFFVFMSIAMIIGILVVCLAPPKQRAKICELTFKRSTERVISYDSRPQHVSVGDFNKDNHVDLVVANSGSDSVGIFMGYGNGSFAGQITYSTEFGSHPYSVAVGDFNNDNHPDIIVANYGTNNIGVLLNYGNGSFANPITTSLHSSRPLFLATGDFDNDKKLDVAVANNGTLEVVVLINFGNGSFRIDTIYDMGYDSVPYSLVVADFNHDHQLDIGVVNYGTNSLAILLSDRKNSSFVSNIYTTGYGSHPCSITAGDFNNDHILDIAITNSGTDNVGIFLGFGNGTFGNIITYSTGYHSRPRFVVIADFDNDAILDMAVVNSANYNVVVFKGTGDGSFSIVATHATGLNSDPCSVAVSDFDNDNKPDIVITNNGNNNILVFTLYSLYSTANSTMYSTGIESGPSAVAVADINNDKQLDIVVGNIVSENIGVFIGLGNGTFRSQQIVFTRKDAGPRSIAVGDFNNDNKSDIVMITGYFSAVEICFGQGDGTFAYGGWYFTGYNSLPSAVTAADINNDNNLDIITAMCINNNVGVFLGFGDGTFTNISSYSTGNGSCPYSVAVGDFNSDNLLDFAAALFGNAGISIHLGDGKGSFDEPLIISTMIYYPNHVTVGDLNQDNRLDIVFVSIYSFLIGVLLGYGNGTFENLTTYFIGDKSFPYSCTLGDFNKDTKLDIAVTSQDPYEIVILFGHGDGTFATQKTISTGKSAAMKFIASGDFDSDHELDIVVTSYFSSNIFVFLMHSTGEFELETKYSTGSSPHPYSIAVADFNNDSLLDIAVANSGNDEVQVFLNDDKSLFMNSTIYSTGSNTHPQCVIVADLNKDNHQDIVVANTWNNSINVFDGSANGKFDEATEYSTGSGSFPTSIAVGDLNNDSWIDVIVANQGGNNLGVFLGFNYSKFISYDIQLPTPSLFPCYVVAADFNNDSRLDMVVAYGVSNTIGIYLGHGNGSFAKAIVCLAGYFPISIIVEDFNNDNRLDIAVVGVVSYEISILLGYGNGSFAKQMSHPTGNRTFLVSIAGGDFNNDNIADIVVAVMFDGYIAVSLGYGNGTFAELMLYRMPNGSRPVWVVVNDFNNDNNLDIAVANRDRNNIGILLGYGNGTFSNVIAYSTGSNSHPCSIAVGDFNKDNWMDIAVANRYTQNIGVIFGYGNGTFSSQTTYSINPESYLNSVTIGDLNSDSILDIAYSGEGNGDGNIGVLYGYGDGKFIIPKKYSTGHDSNPKSIAIVDFDNDGRLDIAVTNDKSNTIGIMLRDKSEPLGTQTVFSTGNDSQPVSIAIHDFDNDNKLDILVANYGTDNIGIFHGYGNGRFAKQVTYSIGSSSRPTSVAVADFNNDKQLDIVVTNGGTDNICILHCYRNGTIAVSKFYSTGVNSIPSFVAINDLNKDNRLDLVISNWGINNVLVFYGSDNETFSNPKLYSLDFNARPQSVAIGDFNNDNWLDIAVTNYGTNHIEILFQTC